MRISFNIKFIIFLLVSVSCKTIKPKVNCDEYSAIIIHQLWMQQDTCRPNIREKIINTWSDNDNFLIGSDTSYFIKILGNPVHKRIYKNGNILFFYYAKFYKNGEVPPIDDMFCFLFTEDGTYEGSFIFFVTDTEYDEMIKFWFSKELPPVSIDGKDNSIPKWYFPNQNNISKKRKKID